ncbi:MAG: PilZ domain-containing protein [Terriglobales bacterium]
MDPNILTEEWGSPQDGKRGTDIGTAYLRHLKTKDADGSSTQPERPASSPVQPARNRRVSQRYQCTGSAQLRAEGGARLWGTLRDISLHGCYVEMATAFPVGTEVRLALEAGGVRMLCAATVRASYPSLGMGMCFSELAPTQELRLKEVLAALAEKRAVLAPQWRSS